MAFKRLFPRGSKNDSGPMADIAFLLLIFFLVTTTVSSEYGIQKQLPAWTDGEGTSPVPESEVFTIHLNAAGELLANEVRVELADLPVLLQHHLWNIADESDRPRLIRHEASISRVSGDRLGAYHQAGEKTMVFLKHHPDVTYEHYIAVQDALSKGYALLWDNVSLQLTGARFDDLDAQVMADMEIVLLAKKAFPVRIAEESTN